MSSSAEPDPASGLRLSSAALGAPLGERLTFVQFSSSFCQPCRAARQTLSHATAQVAGVVHIEIDAESHLDLVRDLEIQGTPTTLVLDPMGRVLRRLVGVPRVADVAAVTAFHTR